MTSLTMNNVVTHSHFAGSRSPRGSFAASLARLQARQETAPGLRELAGMTGRLALALVPAGALAWLFVFA